MTDELENVGDEAVAEDEAAEETAPERALPEDELLRAIVLLPSRLLGGGRRARTAS